MSVEMWKVRAVPAWSAGVARRMLLRRRYGFDAWHVRATPANRPYKGAVVDMLVARGVRSVADIGCGLGDLGGLLPRTVRYVGFDMSPEVIAAARHVHRKESNCRFALGSFAQAGGEPFDALVSIAWVDGLPADVLVRDLLVGTPNARFIVIDAVTDKPDSHDHLDLVIPGFGLQESRGPAQDERLDRVLLLYRRDAS